MRREERFRNIPKHRARSLLCRKSNKKKEQKWARLRASIVQKHISRRAKKKYIKNISRRRCITSWRARARRLHHRRLKREAADNARARKWLFLTKFTEPPLTPHCAENNMINSRFQFSLCLRWVMCHVVGARRVLSWQLSFLGEGASAFAYQQQAAKAYTLCCCQLGWVWAHFNRQLNEKEKLYNVDFLVFERTKKKATKEWKTS